MSTLETPAALRQLIDKTAVDAWPQKKPGGTTRRRMIEDAIRKAARLRRFDLKADLASLINAEFQSHQANRLHHLLAAEFAGVPAPANQRAFTDWQRDLREALRNWIRTAIWQYTDFRKLLVDSWAAAVELPDFESHRQRMADCVWADVADTFAEAVTSGQAFMLQHRKDASERFGKARNGLAKTVDSVLEAAREFSTEARPRVRRGISDLSNAAVAALFEGFSRVTFHDNSNMKVDAYELFRRSPESWVDLGQVLHLLGYASRPLPSFVRQSTDAHGVEWTLCEGLWRATRAIATPDDPPVVLPSATRGRLAGPRLEFFVSVYHADTAWSEQLFTIFLAPVTSGQHIRDLTDRASRDTPYALIVVRQFVPDYDLCHSTPFTQVPELPRDTMAPSAAQVDEWIRDAVRVAAAGGIDRGDSSLRNFAVDFPLDEAARISERYLVERPSVHDYVMRVVTRPGLYLNCGMRRSGKTTAFHPDLLKRMGVHAKEVVAQTCRANGQLGDSFFTWLRKTYRDQGHLAAEVIDTQLSEMLDDARLLVLDEYESLFRWLHDIGTATPTAKHDFVNPLLDSLVRASESWGFLFLGLEPGAARIFMEDNPLTPRLQTQPFPMFQHAPGDTTSEFSQLVRIVLTTNFDVEPMLVDRLFYFSAGHPHFAVSLLREFLDWRIQNINHKKRLLRAEWWDDFEHNRLVPLLMQHSPFFGTYSGLHARWREDAHTWLGQVSQLAEILADGHVGYGEAEHLVQQVSKQDRAGARQAIQDGCRSNILTLDANTQQIAVRVPAYGRLAASWRV
jgi:hypothetical protein